MTIYEIPFSYLVVWQKAHSKSVKGLTYLRTLSLSDSISSDEKWGNIIHELTDNASLRKLNKNLAMVEDTIVGDYFRDTTTVVLPANAAKYNSFYERVKAFVKEYRETQEEIISQPGITFIEAQRKKIHVFRESFEYTVSHPEVKDRADLAMELALSRQRVDQYLKSFALECAQCLSGDSMGRLVADPLLISDFKEFREQVGVMVSAKTFRRLVGAYEYDEKTPQFLASVLGMRFMVNDGCPIPVVASDLLISKYSRIIGQIISYFRKEVIGVRTNFELKGLLNKIPDSTMRAAIQSLISNSDEFIKYDDHGEQAVTLRWDLLLCIPSRVCWILWENNALDYNTAIHQNDIVKSYNKLARLYNDDMITVGQLRPPIQRNDCKNILSLGKTGYWKIRTNRKEKYDFDAYIRNYLNSKKNKASYDEFLQIIKKEGLYRFYENEKSIATRYKNNGGTIETMRGSRPRHPNRLTKIEYKRRSDYIVFLLENDPNTYTQRDLYQMFIQAFPDTNYGTYSQWVRKLIDEGKINGIKGSGQQPTYISAKAIPTTPPKSESDIICDKAFEMLMNNPSHEILTIDLYQELRKLIIRNTKNKTQIISRALHKDGRFFFTTSQTIRFSKKVGKG